MVPYRLRDKYKAIQNNSTLCVLKYHESRIHIYTLENQKIKKSKGDVIMDCTTHDDSAMETLEKADTSQTSTTLDHHQINSPAWRKDPLIDIGGPMTRSRAKKMKEALHGLVRNIQQATKPQVVVHPTFVTLLKVIED